MEGAEDLLGPTPPLGEVLGAVGGAKVLGAPPRHEHFLVGRVGLDRCGEPVQLLAGEVLRAGLYAARRTLRTGLDLLAEKQQDRLENLFAADEHVEVEATWSVYQRMIASYRDPDRTTGKELMNKLIEPVGQGVPAALREVTVLGRTLKQRAADILAYFDRPGTSNGTTEAINGRLEHLLGSSPGFRNLTNYNARSLLETGGFRPRLHPSVKSQILALH